MRFGYSLFPFLMVLSVLGPAAHAGSNGREIYPALFGTSEEHSSDTDRFFKWTSMLERWNAERRAASAPCAPGEWSDCEPAEWRQAVDRLQPLDLRGKLAAVNDLVNRHPYVPSSVNWDNPNYWETPFEFFHKNGQCQDYAITKFMLLRAAGVANDQMRIVVLRDTYKNLDHAVVVVYVDGQALMLDNQIKEVVPVDTIARYRPYYSINETGWWLHEPNPLNITVASVQ